MPAPLLGAAFALWLVGAVFTLWLVGDVFTLWVVFVDVPVADAELALLLVDETGEVSGIDGSADVEEVVDVPVG